LHNAPVQERILQAEKCGRGTWVDVGATAFADLCHLIASEPQVAIPDEDIVSKLWELQLGEQGKPAAWRALAWQGITYLQLLAVMHDNPEALRLVGTLVQYARQCIEAAIFTEALT
jgi:hypothetical protein